jgi:hypothetical protein
MELNTVINQFKHDACPNLTYSLGNEPLSSMRLFTCFNCVQTSANLRRYGSKLAKKMKEYSESEEERKKLVIVVSIKFDY